MPCPSVLNAIKFRPFSICGKVTFLSLGLWLFMLSIISFQSVWWSVNFTKCNDPISSTYYYLLLDDGLCVDSKQGQISNYDSCSTWQTISRDAGGSAAADASKYIHTEGLCISTLVFSLFCSFIVVSDILSKHMPLILHRSILIGFLSLVGLMFFAALCNSSQSYWTQVDNYSLNDSCSESYSGPAIGWVAVLFGFFTSLVGLFLALFPCAQCAADNQLELHQPLA